MKLSNEDSVYHLNKVANFRKGIFDKIARKDNEQIWLKASLKDVRNVVLINSAPRSGSSLLFEILRKIPGVYSLNGESVPFYKLNGLSSDCFPSDKIPGELIEKIDRNFDISRDFLSGFSIINNQNGVIDDDLLNQYIEKLILRFAIQWPKINFDYDVFKKLAMRAIDFYFNNNKQFFKEQFYLELFRFLRTEYKDINPYYYDIPQDMIREKFPDIKVSLAPPNNVLMIEEPPFILLSPQRSVNVKDLSDKILLLKSPLNCYRMEYIKRMFPNADVKVIYLIRNPAASINGLYDGWLYRGFFSHNLASYFSCHKTEADKLNIAGYSDKYAWGKFWWNFDLPPGWENYIDKSLEEVCAFQWYSANKAMQGYINNRGNSVCKIRYENVVRSLESRISEMEKIIDFIGLKSNIIKILNLNELPVVQTTCPPQFYRWKKKKDILLPILDNIRIFEMYNSMGYRKKNIKQWL